MKVAPRPRAASAAAARSAQRALSSMFRPGPLMSRLQLSQLLRQQFRASFGRLIEPSGQLLALGRFEQPKQLIQRAAESADGVGEGVAVVLEDIAPQRPLPSRDAGRFAESLSG